MHLNHLFIKYAAKQISLFLLVAVSVSTLSSCGFKLRGAYTLPLAMQETFIEAQQVSADLVRALKISLKASEIKIADKKAANVAVLKLYKEVKDKRTVSVDSKGRAREYTLTYALNFAVTAQQQKFEIVEQTIYLERDFLFDPEDVLGNSRGESQLYEEMQQDLVRLLLLRLQSKA